MNNYEQTKDRIFKGLVPNTQANLYAADIVFTDEITMEAPADLILIPIIFWQHDPDVSQVEGDVHYIPDGNAFGIDFHVYDTFYDTAIDTWWCRRSGTVGRGKTDLIEFLKEQNKIQIDIGEYPEQWSYKGAYAMPGMPEPSD